MGVYNKEYWDNIATKTLWNTVGAKNSFFRYYRKLIDTKVLEILPELNDKKILEIGSGLGRWSLFFAQNKARVLATDVSKNMIKNIKKEAKKLKLRNIRFKVLDISNNKVNEKFDIIFISSVLQHIYNDNDFSKAVSNISKSLNDNGKVIMVETAPVNFLSKPLQYLADKAKGVKDCSYRSFCRYKEEFLKNNLRLSNYSGIDLSFPIIYSYYALKARKKNWVGFFYHTEQKQGLLDTLIIRICSFFDIFSNTKFLKRFTLLKIMVFKNENSFSKSIN